MMGWTHLFGLNFMKQASLVLISLKRNNGHKSIKCYKKIRSFVQLLLFFVWYLFDETIALDSIMLHNLI